MVKKLLTIFIIIIIINTLIKINLYTASVNESPVKSFTGNQDAQNLYDNIDFYDIKGDIWSKEAIYETGALGFMKGYGRKTFGRKDYLTKEQALALVIRLAGLESSAQTQAININDKRPTNKKTSPGIYGLMVILMWLLMGLITR